MSLSKFLAVLFLIALVGSPVVRSAAVEEEEGVVIMTDDNFDDLIKENQYVLAEFYAPWCGHCKSLAPEYAKAAQKLAGQEPKIVLGKLDATIHKKQSEKHGVQGFPTLKFFIDGEAMEYGGGRTEPEILNWLKKKTQPSTAEINSAEEVEKMKNDNDVVVGYFGENNADFETFSKVTKTVEDVVFFHSFSTDLKAHFEAGSVVLFKNFDEKRNNFEGEMTSDNLKSFVETNMYPTVMEFNQKAAQRIFGENLAAMFVVINKSEQSTAARAAFDEAANSLKGKIVLSWSQIEENIGKRLGDFLGIKDSELPLVYIVKPADGDVKKFRMEGDITTESILAYHAEYVAGNLKTKLKSDEVPETNDEPVKIVVGKSFNDIVMDETKDVLMEFYAPWCGHCKTLAPKYDELATKLKANPNIVIAKMDSTTNEVDGVSVSGFPTLKFFPSNKKQNPMDYSGAREVDGFLKFLKENTTFDWVDLDGSSKESAETKEDL